MTLFLAQRCTTMSPAAQLYSRTLLRAKIFLSLLKKVVPLQLDYLLTALDQLHITN